VLFFTEEILFLNGDRKRAIAQLTALVYLIKQQQKTEMQSLGTVHFPARGLFGLEQKMSLDPELRVSA
jgi:hypothetical protein